jgi:hypothetical protein
MVRATPMGTPRSSGDNEARHRLRETVLPSRTMPVSKLSDDTVKAFVAFQLRNFFAAPDVKPADPSNVAPRVRYAQGKSWMSSRTGHDALHGARRGFSVDGRRRLVSVLVTSEVIR